MIIMSVISSAFCMSCTSNEFEEVQNELPKAKSRSVISRSIEDFDYSQYTLIEKRTVMPRSGEYFQGTVTYMNTAFPLHIYWDLDFEDYNLYAYVAGSNYAFHQTWVGDIWDEYLGNYYDLIYKLDHVATYRSECSDYRFDLVIKCNFSSKADKYNEFWENDRHVAFHIIFYPATRSCSSSIIEEGEGPWRMLEID